jgi:hypothetical protein
MVAQLRTSLAIVVFSESEEQGVVGEARRC